MKLCLPPFLLLAAGSCLAAVTPAERIEAIAYAPGTRTEALLIRKDGRNLLERYTAPFTASTRHVAWSVTKTVGAALAGALVQQGKLGLSDSLCVVSRRFRGAAGARPELCALGVSQLLSWSSGIAWTETYEGESAGSLSESSVGQMLFGDGLRDMLGFYLAHGFRAAPGRRFFYNSGDSTALLGALAEAAGEEAAREELPWKLLFEPLGMSETTFEPDAEGNFVGGSSLFLSARDLARFGELFLNDGVWAGRRLLPSGWIRYSTLLPESFTLTSRDVAEGAYAEKLRTGQFLPGHGWWKFRSAEEGRSRIPGDTFLARGHWGQFLVLIPSERLLIVRFGDDRQGDFKSRLEALVEAAIELGREGGAHE